ncbi:MAG: hypothetical protein HQL31_10070, partial [Planctomycetes bacterium]|nr:hypothetical protein [Planctomycetota bacterium]
MSLLKTQKRLAGLLALFLLSLLPLQAEEEIKVENLRFPMSRQGEWTLASIFMVNRSDEWKVCDLELQIGDLQAAMHAVNIPMRLPPHSRTQRDIPVYLPPEKKAPSTRPQPPPLVEG